MGESVKTGGAQMPDPLAVFERRALPGMAMYVDGYEQAVPAARVPLTHPLVYRCQCGRPISLNKRQCRTCADKALAAVEAWKLRKEPIDCSVEFQLDPASIRFGADGTPVHCGCYMHQQPESNEYRCADCGGTIRTVDLPDRGR